MTTLRKLRLWARLIRLAWQLMRRPARHRHILSEAEAIHRALGHDHDPRLILPEHDQG